MKKNAFTLLEMMIVLLIVTVVLLITLPNIQQKEKIIRAKGCESLLSVVDSQIILYEIENDATPTIDELIAQGYLREDQAKCPDGSTVVIVNGQAESR